MKKSTIWLIIEIIFGIIGYIFRNDKYDPTIYVALGAMAISLIFVLYYSWKEYKEVKLNGC